MPKRLPLWFIVLLCLWYVLPGLTGHEPWKQDEPYIFGIVRHMLNSHDWIAPNDAGVPFMEKPPLYYWLGALFVRLTQNFLPMPDGVRLASGALTATTLLFTGMSARLAWGEGYGRLAVLCLLASFGLLYESHIMITDDAMLSGYAIASYGFLRGRTHALRGGLWLGIGIGIGFLGKGLLIPGTIGVTAVLLLLFRNWRQRIWLQTLAIACLTTLPFLLIWPIALWLRSHELFYEWFWLNNVGRFLGFSVPQLGADHTHLFWEKTLPWFAWPLWPLAIFTLWHERRTAHPALQFALTAFVVYFAVLQLAASARTAYGLPMLIGLALLAAPATTQLPERVNLIGDYFFRLLFLPTIVISWLVWGIFQTTHRPPAWHWLKEGLNPDFFLPFQPFPVALGVLTTIAWLGSWYVLPRIQARAILSGALSITTFWVLFSTLWLPWVDNGKNYQATFISATQRVPTNYICVSGEGLGESTRPLFDYYFDSAHIRHFNLGNPACDLRFIDQRGKTPPPHATDIHDIHATDGWYIIWQGNRPQDDKDTFWLLQRFTQPAIVTTALPSHAPH